MRAIGSVLLAAVTAASSLNCRSGRAGGFTPEPPLNPSEGPLLHSAYVLLHSGQLRVPVIDVQGRGNELGLTLSRTYRLGEPGDGLLGPGWFLAVSRRLLPDGADALLLHDGTGLVHRMARNGARFEGPPGIYAVAESSGNGHTVSYAGGEVDRFDAAGRLVGFDDQAGRRTEVMLDGQGRPVSVLRWDGERIDLAYDAGGRLTSVILGSSRLDYVYDAAGRLVSVLRPAAAHQGPADARGNRVEQPAKRLGPSYAYDDRDRLVAARDPGGEEIFSNVFDDEGRVVEQSWDGASTRYEYLRGGVVRVTDRRGGRWEYQHDDTGHAVRLRQFVANVVRETAIEYNAAGEVVRETLPSGRQTRRTCDGQAVDPRDRGNLLELSVGPAEAPRITRFTYTRDQKLRSAVSPRGNDPAFAAPTPGSARAERYRTVWLYEFDELEATLGVDFDGDGTVVDRDLNGDGRTGPARNLPIVVRRPTRYDFDGAVSPTEEVRRYDDDGLVVEDVSPGGTLATYEHGRDGRRGLLVREVLDAGAGTNPVTGLRRRNLERVYDYDANRQLIATTAGGRTILYRYDALGQVVSIRYGSASGREVRQKYDASGRLVLREIDRIAPDGRLAPAFPVKRERTVYDGQGRPIREESEIAPGVFETVESPRDAAGNVLRVPVPAGAVLDATYAADGEPTELRRGGATVVGFRFDPDGRIAEISTDDGRAQRWTYDPYGGVATHVREDGVRADYVYDPEGNPVKITLIGTAGAMVERRAIAYDELGRPIEERRDLLDAAGQPSGRGSVRRRFSYDDDGHASTLDEDGTVSASTFDGTGQMAAWRDPAGNAFTWSYDQSNNLATSTRSSIDAEAPGGVRLERTTHAYDDDDRLISSSDDTGRIWRYEQGPEGPLRIVDPLGNEVSRLFDGAGRVTATILAPALEDLIEVASRYDDDGRVVSRIDDNANETRYQYDDLYGVAAVALPDGTPDPAGNPTSRITYGPGGRILTREDPNGTRITYRYDAAGRVVRRDIAPGAGVVAPSVETYTYDPAGRLTSASSSGVTVALTYDSLGRIVSDTQPLGTFSYRYDGAGLRAGVTYANGFAIDYTRDTLGRVIAASAGAETLVRYSYTGTDRLLSRDVLGVARTEWSYQGAVFSGEPSRITHRLGGRVVSDHTLGRDLLGALTSEVAAEDGGATDRYTYDGVGRLVSADIAWLKSRFVFSLDGASNRPNVQVSRPGGELLEVPAKFGPRNQLLSRAADRFAYDRNGNRISRRGLAITYDHRNRPVHIVGPGGAELSYAYDPFGRRVASVEKTATGTTVDCRYGYILVPGAEWARGACEVDEICLFGEVALLACVEDGGPAEATAIVYGHGEGEAIGAAAALVRPEGRYVVFQDVQGSPSVVAPEKGGVLERYRYDPDGGQALFLDAGSGPWTPDAVENAPSKNPLGYKGLWRGRASWAFLDARTRDYDPATGLFVQPDSRGDWADASCLGNGYCAFGASAPNGADPFGTWNTFVGDEHGPMVRRYLLAETTQRPTQCILEYNRNTDDTDSHASHQGLRHFDQLEYHGQVARPKREEMPVKPTAYNAHASAIPGLIFAAMQDKNCTEVTHQYGELLHAVQDVNSHRGMDNLDHLFVDPDGKSNPSHDPRLRNAERVTQEVVTRLADVNDWMGRSKNMCNCCVSDDVSASWAGFLFQLENLIIANKRNGYVPRTWDHPPYTADSMVPAPAGGYRWTNPPRRPRVPRRRTS